jgi:PhnB protein
MRLDPYINYRGTCDEAFRYYEQHLGGRIVSMSKHSDTPNPQVPANWRDKVLHARVQIGSTILMGADIPNAEAVRSSYLALTVDSEAEAERIYKLLADGGEVFMKMEKTFFASRFAMLRDRFGTSWMLLHDSAADR